MFPDEINFFDLIRLLKLLYEKLIDPENDEEAFENLKAIRIEMKGDH